MPILLKSQFSLASYLLFFQSNHPPCFCKHNSRNSKSHWNTRTKESSSTKWTEIPQLFQKKHEAAFTTHEKLQMASSPGQENDSSCSERHWSLLFYWCPISTSNKNKNKKKKRDLGWNLCLIAAIQAPTRPVWPLVSTRRKLSVRKDTKLKDSICQWKERERPFNSESTQVETSQWLLSEQIVVAAHESIITIEALRDASLVNM